MLDSIRDEVAYYYLQSADFNGITVAELTEKLSIDDGSLRSSLADLICDGSINALFGGRGEIPHVQRTGFKSPQEQEAALQSADSEQTCIYPAAKVLGTFVVPAIYGACPYSLALALGEPQFNYRSFDLSVLEHYRNDPRFYYVNDDISGMISFASDSDGSESLLGPDRPFLRSFGFCYDGSLNRGVAVFLRYLSRLPPGHQSVWKLKELPAGFQIHPDYYRRSVFGVPGTDIPILKALLLEVYVINQISRAMSRPKLFRVDYGKYCDGVPTGFAFLARPTPAEFSDFVVLLDEMLLQNIDINFFAGDISFEENRRQPNGKVVVKRKGALQVLDAWVRMNIRLRSRRKWNEAINSFWHIRSLRLLHSRQQSSGPKRVDCIDQDFFRLQRDLVIRAYRAVRTLRLILASHPNSRNASIEIPTWLTERKVLTI